MLLRDLAQVQVRVQVLLALVLSSAYSWWLSSSRSWLSSSLRSWLWLHQQGQQAREQVQVLQDQEQVQGLDQGKVQG